MKKLIFIIILIVILVFFASSSLSADIYVKSMKQTEAYEMMGKKHPAKVRIEEQWLAKNKFAIINEDINIIADYEKEKLYFIIHKLKLYVEFPTNIDRTKLLEILPPKVGEVIKSIKVTDVKVNLSGKRKKIANWNCYESEFEFVFMIQALNIMPKIKIKLWSTKDIPFNCKEYTRGMSEFWEKFIFGIVNIDKKSIKEFEKLDKVEGFQVASEAIVNIFGTRMREESQSLIVVEKPAPAGVYSVPKGYTKKTLDSLLGQKK